MSNNESEDPISKKFLMTLSFQGIETGVSTKSYFTTINLFDSA
jgi:hypothetical protein